MRDHWFDALATDRARGRSRWELLGRSGRGLLGLALAAVGLAGGADTEPGEAFVFWWR